jgi:hypothetical protein
MPQSSPSDLVVQLTNIRDVAEDLSHELFRVGCNPTSVIHAMTLFIKGEAETALNALEHATALVPDVDARGGRGAPETRSTP